jgi:hypothetical protein
VSSLVRLGRRLAALPGAIARWARMPRPPGAARRRFVIVQVCGLSHDVLTLALAQGRMPATARLVRKGRLRIHRVPASLPTSTPAFQAGLMYGGPVDIPGFEFVDKRTGEYLWFPRPWDAARVEAAHARGRRGIVHGGRTYGCVFGGGAADTVLTFAHLLRPGPRWGHLGLRARVVPTLLLAWVVVKMSVVSLLQRLRWLAAALRAFSLGHPIGSPRHFLVRLVVSGWLRELCTLGVTADVYAGVPALYVNYVDYDVTAHALGPTHPAAFRALRAVDASIRDIAAVIQRARELRYDLFVLSDHGQIRSVPFAAVAGTDAVAEVILAAFGPGSGTASPPRSELREPAPMPLWPFVPEWHERPGGGARRVRERNAVWAGDLCVVPAGPNVNVYLTHTPARVQVEEIEARYPGALARLARHPAIGFVLARDARGSVCYYRDEVIRIPPPPGPTGSPLFDRPDRAVVVAGLQDLLAMPSGGDVVLFGHYTASGCVNFLGERGSHAGPSEAELYPFVMAPPHVRFDFEAVARPRDLYPLFAGYHEPGDGKPPRHA